MTAFVRNITFDCANPHRVAEFWAAVTGYEVCILTEDVVRLDAPDGRGVRHFLFFAVHEPKLVKNRMHLDLASRTLDTEIPRLLKLGATLVDDADDDGPRWRGGGSHQWVVMQDPEGNEFCIGGARPGDASSGGLDS